MAERQDRSRLRREREGAGSTLRSDGETARGHKYDREERVESEQPEETAVPDTLNSRHDTDSASGTARSPTDHSGKLRSDATASRVRRGRLRMDHVEADAAGEHVYGGRKAVPPSDRGYQGNHEHDGLASNGGIRSEGGLVPQGRETSSGKNRRSGSRAAGAAGTADAGRHGSSRSNNTARTGPADTSLSKEAPKYSSKLKRPHPSAAQTAVSNADRAAHEADTDSNVGVQASLFAEETAAGAGDMARSANYSRKLRKRRREEEERERLQFESEDRRRMFEGETEDAGPEGRPEHNAGTASSNAYSRWRQRQDLKKEYAARRSGRSAEAEAGKTAEGWAESAGKVVSEKLEDLGESAAAFARDHSHEILLAAAFAVVILVVVSLFSSCGMMAGSGSNLVIGTSYTAEDDDILNVEDDYTELELALQDEIDNIESTHPGYDEYRYNLVEIGHDPYALASLLTVEFEDYTREEVQARLQEIFEAQYELTLVEEEETRYRTQTLTGYREVEDPETGEITIESYTYEAEVPYQYYILNITLTNRGLDEVAYDSGLSEEDLERYVVLLETYGNRRDLFEDGSYAYMRMSSGGTYLTYDIPGEALTDTAFANMIAEAEKYLGMAYVWGGSSPSTGFDCSGFVSWVINNCGNGWSVGRLTANGLLGVCDIITADEAQPGDLVFFEGTYSTSGASHVGIYVGNGMMIHCGDPISYASIETDYWQSHLLCFGRITG